MTHLFALLMVMETDGDGIHLELEASETNVEFRDLLELVGIDCRLNKIHNGSYSI